MPWASEFTKFGNMVLYLYLYASVKSMTMGNVYDYLPLGLRLTFALLAACEFTLIWKCILNSVTILESVKLWSSISKSMNSESSCEYVNFKDQKLPKSKPKASVDAGIEKIQEVHHHHKGESDIQSDYDLRDGSSLAHLMESSHNPKKQKSDNETEILDQLTVNPRKKLKFKK